MAVENVIADMRANLKRAYTSVENKGATMPENKNLENLANTIDSIPAGGGDAIINGLIENYYVYAGENISAGDFVNFATGVLGTVELEMTETPTTPAFLGGDGEGDYPLYYSSTKCPMNFVQLTETRLFVAMGTRSTRSVFVMQFNDDGTITMGPKILTGNTYKIDECIEKLADNMVYAYHHQPTGYNNANVEDDYMNIYRIEDNMDITKFVIKYEDGGDVDYNGNYRCLASTKIDDNHIILIGKLTSNDAAPTLITLADDYSDLSWSRSMLTMANTKMTNSSYDTYRYCYQMSNNRLMLITEGYSSKIDVFLWEVTPTKITFISKTNYAMTTNALKYQVDDTHILFIYRDNSYNIVGCIYTLNEDNTFTAGTVFPLTNETIIRDAGTATNIRIYGYPYVFGFDVNPLNGNIVLLYSYAYSEYHKTDKVNLAETNELHASILKINDDYSISIVANDCETNLIPELSLNGAARQIVVKFIGIPSSQNFAVFYDEVYDLEYPDDSQKYDAKYQTFHINSDNTIEGSYINGGTRLMYETQVKKATSAPFYGVAKTAGVGGDETAHKDQIEIYTL